MFGDSEVSKSTLHPYNNHLCVFHGQEPELHFLGGEWAPPPTFDTPIPDANKGPDKLLSFLVQNSYNSPSPAWYLVSLNWGGNGGDPSVLFKQPLAFIHLIFMV